MTWIKTDPLKAGPLIKNWYNHDITGLTASTTYRYRSYFIVDGVEYRGINTYTATTATGSYQVPTVTTGIADTVYETSMNISDNEITGDGSTSVTEYGILYTQSSVWGTDANLIYSNAPTNVSKVSTLSIPTIPKTFDNTLTPLSPSTLTYFRAFAKNAMGIGYGIVKTASTASSSILVSFLSAVEIDDYSSVATLEFLGHSVGTTYTITFKYYLMTACSNDNLPYGENFDNETTLEITKNNFSAIDYSDNVFIEIINDDEYVTQATTPVPKTVTISNITDINNFKIKFIYNFDNYGSQGSRSAIGYILIDSVVAVKDGYVLDAEIVGENKFSIRAILSTI